MSVFQILNSLDSLDEILKNSDFIVSVDPGIKNLLVSILDRNLKLNSYHKITLQKTLMYKELTEKLGKVLEDISSKKACLLIEKQLTRGSVLLRIQQHIIVYFMVTKPDMPIIELNPKNRAIMLRQYYNKKKITKRDCTSWVIDALKKTNDIYGLHIIRSLKKKDDFADTICQVHALLHCTK